MSWVRLDDQWADHPKFLDVGDLGQLVWVKGLSYAARYLTDGFIPTKATPKFLRQPRHVPVAIRDLLDAGLWTEVEGGYQVHDYGDFQPLAAQVKADREATRARVKRWRERTSDAVTPPVTNSVTNGVGNGLRGGARAGAGPGSGSDPEGSAEGGTVPPSDSPAESGYDLAWRVWSELWAGRYGEAYQRTTDTGAKSDDRTMQRIGVLALEHGERAETVLRQKLGQYLATQSPWLVSHRHPPRTFESDWNSFGNALPSKLARVCVESDEREPTDEERAARRKEMEDRAEWAAKERERRRAHEQTLGAK